MLDSKALAYMAQASA